MHTCLVLSCYDLPLSKNVRSSCQGDGEDRMPDVRRTHVVDDDVIVDVSSASEFDGVALPRHPEGSILFCAQNVGGGVGLKRVTPQSVLQPNTQSTHQNLQTGNRFPEALTRMYVMLLFSIPIWISYVCVTTTLRCAESVT